MRLNGRYKFGDELGAIQFMEQVDITAKEEQSDLHGLVMDKIEVQGGDEERLHTQVRIGFEVRIPSSQEYCAFP
jgi:hypothetical protein